MSDQDILDAFDTGILRIDVDGDLGVEKWHRKNKTYVRLAEREHRKNGRITFNLANGTGDTKTQRTVYRNKLVWMWVHRRLVPEGYHIDHENGVCTDDRPDNLRLRDGLENSGDNVHSGMRECSEYFLLAELGFDPDIAYH